MYFCPQCNYTFDIAKSTLNKKIIENPDELIKIIKDIELSDLVNYNINFIKKDILPAEVPFIDAIKLRVALQNILDGDTAFNNGNLEAEDTDKVTDESYQVQLAKNEIKFLNTQLYNEYKKVKKLKQEVIYLEDKRADREQELEHISHKLLNKSLGYREDD